MTSMSTAMPTASSAAPSGTTIDQLRQAALLSKRRKMQAVETSESAVPPSMPKSVPSQPSASSISALGTKQEVTTTLKRNNPDREEGEISEEDEPPPPPKAPRRHVPPPRHAPSAPRAYWTAQAEDYPRIVPQPTLSSRDIPLRSSTVSAPPPTRTSSNMQAQQPLQRDPLAPATWSQRELEEVQNTLQQLMGMGITPESIMRGDLPPEFLQNTLPHLHLTTSASPGALLGSLNSAAHPPLPGSGGSQFSQNPIPIPLFPTEIESAMQPTVVRTSLTPNATVTPPPRLSSTADMFSEFPSGIPGLSVPVAPTSFRGKHTTFPSPAELDQVLQKEEYARRAALATRKLRAERAAAVATASTTRTSPVPSSSTRVTESTRSPAISSAFLDEFDALLAEVASPARSGEDGEGVEAFSPAPTYDTDLADEREIESAMFATDDDDAEMEVETPSPTNSSDENPAIGLPTIPTVTASESTSSSTTPGDVTPILPSESIAATRPNGRAFIADLDAQPLSRPEQAPVLSRPHHGYRRSYHHQRREEYRPLVIDISDSEDDGSDDDVSTSKSPEAPVDNYLPQLLRKLKLLE
ncbi:hypothetical protein DACRYDRAFT_90856 [Dacryopinax primogenitus]|uniref:Uncharacterized protein n=1 Tax=Dacryopinax primogenitus (strain DJM 731) TaxID=1858805 RepID=M5FSG2_DACPD|nr:uncharacterized protein DACRYDRAFT_90856 [Dacryopinax primogenitus]EJT98803.1 hypothetical protein DACRYDRAFT_90856 [Dacryopinax primogenitus]